MDDTSTWNDSHCCMERYVSWFFLLSICSLWAQLSSIFRHHVYPDIPEVGYPEGFQGNAIPVSGPYIVQLLEDRVAGKL